MKIADYIQLRKTQGGFIDDPPFILSKSETDNRLITQIAGHIKYVQTWRKGYDKTVFRLNSKDKFLLL